MTYFFVDYENVKEDGLDLLRRVKREDKIFIFYSENVPKISLDLVGVMLGRKLTVQLVKVITGHKDSLDHQMAIYLGMFMSKSKEDDYCVISGDMAFSDVVTFYRRKKYRIYRVTQMSEYYCQINNKSE